MTNCHRKPQRWQLELHLSLCSFIRLPVITASVTCHPVTGTGSRARRVVINIDLEFYKSLSLYFEVWAFFFFLVEVSISLLLFLSSSILYPPTHICTLAHTHTHSLKKMLPSLKNYTLLTPLLKTARNTAGCLTFFSFQENWGMLAWFFFPILPFHQCVKAQWKHTLLTENTLLCIRQETLTRLSHMSALESVTTDTCQTSRFKWQIESECCEDFTTCLGFHFDITQIFVNANFAIVRCHCSLFKNSCIKLKLACISESARHSLDHPECSSHLHLTAYQLMHLVHFYPFTPSFLVQSTFLKMGCREQHSL